MSDFDSWWGKQQPYTPTVKLCRDAYLAGQSSAEQRVTKECNEFWGRKSDKDYELIQSLHAKCAELGRELAESSKELEEYDAALLATDADLMKAEEALKAQAGDAEQRVKELDTIATELQVTCDKQAKRIAELERALGQYKNVNMNLQMQCEALKAQAEEPLPHCGICGEKLGMVVSMCSCQLSEAQKPKTAGTPSTPAAEPASYLYKGEGDNLQQIPLYTHPAAERPDHRAVMEQALEALEQSMKAWNGTCAWQDDVEKAITALRNALKEEI